MHCTGKPAHSCIRSPPCCTRLAAALQSRRFQPTTQPPEWLSKHQHFNATSVTRTLLQDQHSLVSLYEQDRDKPRIRDHKREEEHGLLTARRAKTIGSCLGMRQLFRAERLQIVSVLSLRSEGPTKDCKAPRAPTNQAVEASSRLAASESSVQHLVRQNGASEPIWALQLQQDHL